PARAPSRAVRRPRPLTPGRPARPPGPANARYCAPPARGASGAPPSPRRSDARCSRWRRRGRSGLARVESLSIEPSTLLAVMDERPLAERLITYDTSTLDGLRAAAGFVKGWLESRDVDVRDSDHEGLPVIQADVGAPVDSGAPTVVLHGHL